MTGSADALDLLFQPVEDFDRQLNRRVFLRSIALLAVAPAIALESEEDEQFLRGVASSLIPAEALEQTGIDVVHNIRSILDRGSQAHREKILRLLAWARRLSFIYGGKQIAVRSRGSRFVLIQKMGKALSSLCLVAFWGDERALQLIDLPETR